MQLMVARADGSYQANLKRIAKANVVILDDFGINPLEDTHKQDLFEVIEDRHGVGATMLTFNCQQSTGMSIWGVECSEMASVIASSITVINLH